MEQNATPSAARWPVRERRLEIQQELSVRLEDALEMLQSGPVDPQPDPDALRARLKQFDFREPLDLLDASQSVIDLLQHGIVHLMHPAYFGLYNPSVTFPVDSGGSDRRAFQSLPRRLVARAGRGGDRAARRRGGRRPRRMAPR